MENGNEFKLTYYVGAMLAHGGVLTIHEDRLIFAPRAFERTMGASDTVIPFDKIKMVEVSGTITESLMVRTLEKAHRFVGSDPYKIRDRINEAIQRAAEHRAPAPPPPVPAPAPSPEAPPAAPIPSTAAAPAAPVPAAPAAKDRLADKCSGCGKPVRAEYHFCPYCKKTLKASCPKCYRFSEAGWKFCAFCGSDIPNPA